MGIGDQRDLHIDHGIDHAAVAGVFDVLDVLE